ncbi:hypothetical protein LLEC1_05595 [Akanthomyces lecanii]|uniref:Beta-lactamase-related domain-containing protein n=1 Tax=Cordyceps confragosa TaxID=2714763 RepID=A0A179ICJ1_CORDF|nr:hypothetical protein LLEC1_05595 [Akanthomyces lecanii]
MAVLDQLETLILANHPQHNNVVECLAELGAPSVSIAVLDNGQVSARCYSVAGDDVETAFQACSISKAANAVATMKLIDEGRLTLNGTLHELLPREYLDIILDGAPPKQRPLIESITIKQLLSHTGGLAPDSFPGYSASATVPTMSEIIAGKKPANTTRFRLVSLPGHIFEYSGAGSTLLQLILEAVSGKEYRDLMQDLVLTPLQMTRSFYSPRKEKDKNIARTYRTGSTECDANHHCFPELAAAGLWTTPTDLLKLIRDVQRSIYGEGGMLKQATAAEMLEEIDGGFSLGWQRRKSQPAVFGHSGSNEPGFRSLCMGFLGKDGNDALSRSGIVVMTNAETGDLLRAQCMQAISALKGWPFPEHEARAQRLGRPASESGNDWKAWNGEWTSKNGRTFLIKEGTHGLPLLVYDGLGEVVLLPAVDGRRGEDGGFVDFVLQGLPLLSMALEEGGGMIKLQRLRGESEELKRL